MTFCALAPAAAAQTRQAPVRADEGAWHALRVPGGRETLTRLGVDPATPRALALVEIVRRLQFVDDNRARVELAIADLIDASADRARLETAIASAQGANARRRLRDVTAAAGLRWREARGQIEITDDPGAEPARRRTRLASVGVDLADLRRQLAAGQPPVLAAPAVTLPLPLSPQTWQRIVFEREVGESQLFAAVLADPRARLLYHGLMALDADTRRWLGAHADLLSQIAGNEAGLRAFSLFSPALRIGDAAVVIPGGDVAARRWQALLDAGASEPERFVSRLFTRDSGRVAGLYALIAAVEPARRSFLLGSGADTSRFTALAARFADCYASESIAYPYAIRFADPALLFLDLDVDESGTPLGPTWRRFWTRALEGESLPDDPARDLRDLRADGEMDAAAVAAAMCDASIEQRPSVLETLLFVNRVFRGVADTALPDVLVAARARRLYPGVMAVLEQAGVSDPATYARVARHAERVARVEDARASLSALQQFQGVVVLTTAAVRSGALTVDRGSRLLDSLAAVPLDDGRYGGQLAAWFSRQWLPAVVTPPASDPSSPEARVIEAIAGVAARAGPIEWEGLSYVLDLAADKRRQLREARRRQGGVTLDSVMTMVRLMADLRHPALTVERAAAIRTELEQTRAQLDRFRVAEEFQGDVPDVAAQLSDAVRDLARMTEPRRVSRGRGVADDLAPIVDLLFGHVLAAWAYAPHLADASPGMGGAGDPSLRHEFGIRLADRARVTRPWEIAWRGEQGGRVTGALFGLDAALARRGLRRLAAQGLPSEPALTANDLAAMQLTAALSDPRRLTDGARDRIAAAVASGAAAVAGAGRDPAALDAAARATPLSAWRRHALDWTAREDAASLGGWFSSAELAAIGGLRPEEVHAWGTVLLPSGCLCVRMPRPLPPEVFYGRQIAAVPPFLTSGPMFRIAPVLAAHRLPAGIGTAVLRYAMRELMDRVRPAHGADLAAFVRAIERIDRATVEDYIGAVAAIGPLVEAGQDKEP